MKWITDQNRKWWVLAATTSAASLIFLSQTIINVSLPILQKEFDASETQVQWVVNSYLLVLASLAIASGRLTDIFSAKVCFLYGIALFTIASIGCGFAHSLTWLIIGRALQGIGGVLLLPSNSALAMKAFEEKERGKALGIQVGISSIFISLGPFIGGVIVEFLSWRWVFWINFPFALFAIIFGLISLHSPEPVRKKESLGIPGIVFLALSLSFFVIAIMQAAEWGLKNPTIYSLLILSFIFIIIFIKIDKKMAQPLVDLTFFKNYRFLSLVFIIAVAQTVQICTIFFTLYVQNILNYSPLLAGISMLPASLPQLFMPMISGRVTDKKGPYQPIIIGLILITIGVFWIFLFASKVDYLLFFPGLTFIGFGIQMAIVPSSITALNISPSNKLGFASGIMGTIRLMATSINLAIIGVIFSYVGKKDFIAHLSHLSISSSVLDLDPSQVLSKNPSILQILHQYSTDTYEAIVNAAIHAFDLGFTRSMIYVTVLCLMGLFVCIRYVKGIKKYEVSKGKASSY